MDAFWKTGVVLAAAGLAACSSSGSNSDGSLSDATTGGGDGGPQCVFEPERCNNKDDDCDGFTDEVCPCRPIAGDPMPTFRGSGALFVRTATGYGISWVDSEPLPDEDFSHRMFFTREGDSMKQFGAHVRIAEFNSRITLVPPLWLGGDNFLAGYLNGEESGGKGERLTIFQVDPEAESAKTGAIVEAVTDAAIDGDKDRQAAAYIQIAADDSIELYFGLLNANGEWRSGPTLVTRNESLDAVQVVWAGSRWAVFVSQNDPTSGQPRLYWATFTAQGDAADSIAAIGDLPGETNFIWDGDHLAGVYSVPRDPPPGSRVFLVRYDASGSAEGDAVEVDLGSDQSVSIGPRIVALPGGHYGVGASGLGGGAVGFHAGFGFAHVDASGTRQEDLVRIGGLLETMLWSGTGVAAMLNNVGIPTPSLRCLDVP